MHEPTAINEFRCRPRGNLNETAIYPAYTGGCFTFCATFIIFKTLIQKQMKRITILLAFCMLVFTSCRKDVEPTSCQGTLANFIEKTTGIKPIGEGKFIDRTWGYTKPGGLSCDEINAIVALKFINDPAAGFGQWWEVEGRQYGIYTNPIERTIELREMTQNTDGVSYHIDWEIIWNY